LERSNRIQKSSDREFYATATCAPEDSGNSIEECPEFTVGRRVAKAPKALICPKGWIPMEGDFSIRKPADVTGKNLAVERRHANRLEELAANTSGPEVDQRCGANIESKPTAAKEAGAAAGQPMCLEDKSSEPRRLKPSRCGHPRYAGSNDCNVVHVRSSTPAAFLSSYVRAQFK